MEYTNGNGHCSGTDYDDENFLKKVAELAIEESWSKPRNQESPVLRFKKPDELLNLINLEISDESTGNQELLELCKSVCDYSVKTAHPRFFNQLYGGLDAHGLAGQFLSEALNTAMYTYEVAPVFVLMEKVVLSKMMDLVGYEDGDATMCPGGSYSNMLGINMARYRKIPQIKKTGMTQMPQLVVLTSEGSHYSIKKSASLMGIGEDNVVMVKCDARGKMIPQQLETEIKKFLAEGKIPFMVNATAGTTVLGAFDPIDEIATICKKYDLWLHVDAAWGGGSLMSKVHRQLCRGIEKSNSVAWNPHKLMMTPLQCSVFLTQEKGLMKACHALDVPYLFHPDKKAYDRSYDTGNQIIQCGRKVDILKLWLMWKAKGTIGFGKQIDAAFDKSRYFLSQVQKKKWFKLVLNQPECTNVCFWFIPPSLRGECTIEEEEAKFPEGDSKFLSSLHKVAPAIKMRMQQEGTTLITYTTVASLPNFFRMVIMNSAVTTEDLDFLLCEIEKQGNDL